MRRHQVRTALELFEQRLCPAVMNWTAGGDGDWAVAANWTEQGTGSHRVPVATDDANLGAATVTSKANHTVNSVYGTLKVESSTFTINAAGTDSFMPGLTVLNGATFKVAGGPSTIGIAGCEVEGELRVETNGTLWFRRQQNNLNAGTTLKGTGLFLSQDDLSAAGNHGVNINGNITAPANFDHVSGILAGSGVLTVPNAVTLDCVTNPVVAHQATIQGSGSIVVESGGKMNVGGSHQVQIYNRTIANSGTLTLQGAGAFHLVGTATIDNKSDGTFRIESSTGIVSFGSPQLINAGKLVHVTSATSHVGCSFQNTGTIDVTNGTLFFRPFTGPGSLAGTVNLNGGNLMLGAVNFQQLAVNATTFTGSGLVTIANGVTLQASVSSQNFAMIEGGGMDGTGTWTVTTSASWTGGYFNGTGTLAVPTGAALTLSGTTVKQLVNWGLTIGGTVNHLSGGDLFIAGSTLIDIQNSGTYNLGDTNLTYAGATINNAGLFVKTSASAGTSGVAHPINNSGTLRVDSGALLLYYNYNQSAGQTAIAAGATLQVGYYGPSNISISGGSLTGGGTVKGNVAASGTVIPGASPGKLTFSSDFSPVGTYPLNVSLTGGMNVELNGITAGTQHDQIVVQGSITLGGTLTTTVGHTYAFGDTMIIVDNDGTDPVSGTFAGLSEGASFVSGGQRFGISYKGGTGNDVILERTNPNAILFLEINDGQIQRSRVTKVKITFSNYVTIPTPNSAFQLVRQVSNETVTLNAIADNSGPTTVVTITFINSATVEEGSLIDGRYTLTAFASQINGGNFDGDGNGVMGDNFVLASAAAPNPPTNIFRQFGDVNGDGFTDNVDLLAYRAANGSQTGNGNYNNAFDINNDGFIDNVDFLAFRARLGLTP